MSNWYQMTLDFMKLGSNYDIVRRQYMSEMHKLTGRNVICYYSGWLQKQGFPNEVSINDLDKNGFMTVFHELDPSIGLDLILHTPGGDTAATESLVDYLYQKFNTNIRCFVPQLAMSAGTMIACSTKEIWMGKHSSLGPIDPQYCGIPAHGIIDEFKRACHEITQNPSLIPIWQPIVAKYNPTLLGECENVIAMSEGMVTKWLKRNMHSQTEGSEEVIKKIIEELANHSVNLAHNRHFSVDKCEEIGLIIKRFEDDQTLQEAILSIHHAFMHTLAATPAIKIIENHRGVAYINQIQQQMMMMQSPARPIPCPPPKS